MRLLPAIAMSVLLVALGAPGAAGASFQGEGFYSRFNNADGARGLVVIDRVGTDKQRLNVAIVGLLPYMEASIVGRSIGCQGSPSSANRIFRVRMNADENGDLNFRLTAWGASDIDLKEFLRSIWINQGEVQGCAVSFNYTKLELVGDWNGDGAIGVALKPGASEVLMETLVERRPNGNNRASVVLFGGNGDSYSLIGSTRSCGQSSYGRQNVFIITLQDVHVSTFKSQSFSFGQERLDSIRSFRLRNTSTNGFVACAPGIIMANTEGDFH